MVKGKKKTFTQDFIPLRKALEYTEQEAKLWKKDKEGNDIKPTESDLTRFRAKFVAGLFDDPDLTGDVILDGLDTSQRNMFIDIIMYRVLGYEKPSEVVVDPKGVKTP